MSRGSRFEFYEKVRVESDDPVKREKTTAALYEKLKQVDKSLIAQITYDERAPRQYAWNNRFLFASLDADVAALSKRAHRKPGASERPARMEPRAGGDPSATVKPPASASVSASADPTERAEAAAQRAEAAAGRLEAAAAEAEHAADRAEASIEGMESAVKTARPKRTVQTARRK